MIIGIILMVASMIEILTIIRYEFNLITAIAAFFFAPAMPIAAVYYGFTEDLWGPLIDGIIAMVLFFTGSAIKDDN